MAWPERNPVKIEESMGRYAILRDQLRDLSVSEFEGSEEFKELLRLQSQLVRLTIDSPGLTGKALKIRFLLRPHHTEVKRYPLYSMLEQERDTTIANYLHCRQK
jgi:hypothetical protein